MSRAKKITPAQLQMLVDIAAGQLVYAHGWGPNGPTIYNRTGWANRYRVSSFDALRNLGLVEAAPRKYTKDDTTLRLTALGASVVRELENTP